VPRQARLDAPGTLHHVIIRGIEQRQIFDDEKDRENFITRLGEIAVDTNTKIYAWTLMTNHAHILLRSGIAGLPKFMRCLLTGYAVTYNRHHLRHGHLFQNRYQSIVCDEDSYFRELVRYIHLNPIRANLVNNISQLDHYPWCGHAVLMERIKHTWQDRDYVLSWFGKEEGKARKAYRQYLKEGVSQGKCPDLVGGGIARSLGTWSAVLTLRRSQDQLLAGQRILGTGDFVERVLNDSSQKGKHPFTSIERRKRMRSIISTTCDKENINIEELRMGSRRGRIPHVRSDIVLQLVKDLGIPLAEIARELGVSTSAISKVLRRSDESIWKKEVSKST
jgi:REP element-mobilizing transposase RayT